ncbi:response regulator [Lacihabitans sp. LS3-19]|uniref:hybrid sensor histidine kinase/response regulator transcription factor n=1 Tax=Lacihabitans sp. LS3-19 TaxID=2487335 RepID=UPI0020CED0A9|nr:response regulator [Lacihabitans sp. LS3-19]
MLRILLLMLLGFAAQAQMLSADQVFERLKTKIENGQDIRTPKQEVFLLPIIYPDSFLTVLEKIKPLVNKYPQLKYKAWYKVSMSGTLEKKAKYQEALSYGLDALRDLQNSKEKLLLADAHNTVGLIHMRLKIKPEQALDHLQKALDIYAEYQENLYMALVHLNKSNVYLHLLHDTESMAKEIEICKTITNNLPPSTIKSMLKIGIGSGYMFTGDYTDAIAYFKEGLQNADNMSPTVRAASYQNLGVTQSLVGDYKNAKENLLIAIDMMDELDNTPLVRSAIFALGKAAKRTYNYEDAAEYLQLAFEWSDTLLLENQEKLSIEIAEKYETELKEQENKNLQSRQNLLYMGLAVLAVVLSLLGFAFLKNRKKNQLLAAQKELLQNQEVQKREFFENITHEFRTPLTIIRGLTQSLQEEVTEQEDVSKRLKLIDQNAGRISHMVDDVLRLAGENKADFNLLRTRLNMKSFFRKMQAMYDLLLKEKGQKLTCTITEPDLTLMLDERKMDIIWSNLISNAIKYSPEGARISIDLKSNGDQVKILINNEGSVIPKEKFDSIFQRYHREHKTQNISGNGIGLAAVKELVEIQEGQISVASSEDEGTTFTLSFPLYLKAESPISEVEFSSTKEKTQVNQSTRILVVDDNPDLLLFMEQLLEREGYKVYMARSGSEALKMLNVVRPDLLITDLVMPEIDGKELLTKARENTFFAELPIIFLTASANEETRLELLEMGIDDFLKKPFEKRELLARIRFITTRQQVAKQERDNVLAEIDESPQRDLIGNLKQYVNKNLSNLKLNIPELAEAMNMTERSLYRHVKSQTGLTPNELIKELRLQRARIILELGKYSTIKQVAYEVGFESSSHFAQIYEQRFGKHPSEYFN